MVLIGKKEMATCIDEIAQDFFKATVEQFPIAVASDEFYYFPQVPSPTKDWSSWDKLSAEAIDGFGAKLLAYEQKLSNLKSDHKFGLDENLDLQIDYSFLRGSIQTLREQLTAVRSWEQQPTFHLTIACLGIAEALDAKDPSAGDLRASTLPDFIENAKKSLINMPVLFRDLGLSMVGSWRCIVTRYKNWLPIVWIWVS